VQVPEPEQGNGAASEWRVTLPGEIRSHNAGSVDGQTLVWRVEPGQTQTLHARTDVGLRLETLGPLGLGMILLLAAGLTAVVMAAPRRRPMST
jgi:hypothetical protein